MNKGRLFLLSFFFLSRIALVFSVNTEQIHFSNIGIDNGLSQNTVFSIAQDRLGNMWFATYDGVNKFDGYEFTVYRHDMNNPESIADDIVRTIITDSKGNVWIGTRAGLSWYDEEKDLFRNYSYDRDGVQVQVTNLEEIAENILLVGTNKGLVPFNMAAKCFQPERIPEDMVNLEVSCLLKAEEFLYIGMNDGLYQYDLTAHTGKRIAGQLQGQRIQAVLKQSGNHLWIATEGDGLYLYNISTQEVKNYRYHPDSPRGISSNYIRSLALDGQNRLWVGTFNGLNLYREASDTFARFTHDPLDSGSLTQNSIRSIFRDAQGGMWFGTYFGGVNYYHSLKNRFVHMHHVPYRNSLNDNVVSCIVEDDEQNLWIGTNDQGLNFYHTKTRRFTHYALSGGGPTDRNANNVKAVYVDNGRKTVYIGTHAGGLSVLHVPTGKIRSYTTTNSELPDENVYAILPDGRGELLIGTLKGLAVLDPSSGKLRLPELEEDASSLKNRQITVLFRDKKKRLWVGGENGLAVYSRNGKVVEEKALAGIDSLFSQAFVNCIIQRTPDEYWIGTRHGLYRLDEKKGRVRRYTTTDGLPNNVIYGILEDSFGRLWLSTNYGLSCFNPNTGNFRNFTASDGLQSNQFNNYSYCKTIQGELFFGGINGITRFRPELLIDNPYTPQVVINELRLFGKTVRPDDETGILSRSISLTNEITFKPHQTAFTLGCVVSNYISGQHNRFAYCLEGYDKEWYYTDDQPVISYSNLPRGSYLFKVIAANSDGRWNDAPTELKIRVLPVWYITWWAVSLLVIATILLIGFIFRHFIIRKSMEAELKMERLEKEKQEEVNQMKMRFFINLSHELRTPLTLILAPVQEMIYRLNDRWALQQLQHIQRNANRLLHLVNQLMDYRRAELGVFQLKVKSDNIRQLIEENFLFYDKLARRKGITYTFCSEMEKENALFDPHYIELILNNLLSNAFKFTPDGGRIEVRLKEEKEQLLISVTDTGTGIPPDKQQKVFERFYQAEGEQMGSGIGLSLVKRLVELHHGRITLKSHEGVGSCFTVYLPQDLSVYKDGERKEEEDTLQEQIHFTNGKDLSFQDICPIAQPDSEEEVIAKGTLLVVEDNGEIRDYLTEGFSSLYRILTAENGEMALEILQQEEVDIIITDVMMPVMDGIKLCKQVKQNIRTCHVPVIMLSAKTDVEHQLEGLQVGADDYIPKPFSLTLLGSKVKNMIRTRRRIFEHYSRNMEIEPEKITFNAMDEQLLKRAVEVVEKNMDNIEFSAEDFARAMNMSRSNLHLKMKAITGESTIEFIRKIRFNEACKLLKDGRYTVAEVSTMVGFNTPSYFATSFKKYFGCLPTEYVKTYRG